MTDPPRRVSRDDAVDLLRGFVMVLMALDHARDFFGADASPLDLSRTTVPLFFTRWVTHLCAPVFVLLAGVAARIAGTRRTPAELTRFLLSRGLWLVFLELTVVRFGWLFNVDYRFSFVQVIWALGWSMVALSVLTRFPLWVVAAVGGAQVLLHNAFDGVRAASFGSMGWLWRVLHDPGPLFPLEGRRVYIAYPLVPWMGVMALGFVMGGLWLRFELAERRRWLTRLGLGCLVVFLVLRVPNLYGDPHPWVVPSRVALTPLAVINAQKYPPSLAYLLMTLGPSLLALAWLSGKEARGAVAKVLVTFGRVPLFYYLLHLPLLHGMAALVKLATGRSPGWSLPGVYAAWALGVAILWWPCRWFAGVKARRRDWWLSYL